MNVNFHNPQRAISNEMTCASGDFSMLKFSKPGDEVTLFLTAEQTDMAHAVADIFNGDLLALVSRIEDAMLAINNRDHSTRGTAIAIACDLIGKDLDEAMRERQEAEDAA